MSLDHKVLTPLGAEYQIFQKLGHYQSWWPSLYMYTGMRVSFSKKSWNLWSWYNFMIFLFKMWQLCIIRNDFRIFHALKIRKSGKTQKTLMPEDKQAFHNKVYRLPTLSQFQEIIENTLKQFSVFRVKKYKTSPYRYKVHRTARYPDACLQYQLVSIGSFEWRQQWRVDIQHLSLPFADKTTWKNNIREKSVQLRAPLCWAHV